VVRRGTKQNENIYINHLSPLQSRRSIILSISVFNHIVWSPGIALTAVLLISFYMERLKFIILRYLGDEISYRLPVCAFVYCVRDCKHPVPAIYINDNNLQVRYYA
jgi:hypothetical protein